MTVTGSATTTRPVTRAARREARRQQILAVATELFGRDGYRATSLRDLARACGVSHPTLLHYFPTKDSLLLAVLHLRDENTGLLFRATSEVREVPAVFLRVAEENAAAPGLVSLYTVLAAEATVPEHPAHAYFRDRFRTALTSFTERLEAARAAGLLRAGVDPARAARSLFALSDGAQVQWLFEPDLVDVPALVADLLRQLFVEEAWPAPLRSTAHLPVTRPTRHPTTAPTLGEAG